MTSARSFYRLFAAVAAALFVFLGTGCRHDVVNEQGETVSVPISPLSIEPALLPFGEEERLKQAISSSKISMADSMLMPVARTEMMMLRHKTVLWK